jgi:hypothetical protein
MESKKAIDERYLESQDVYLYTLDELTIHDIANTQPRMTTSQFEALKESISSIGQKDPVVVFRSKIIDGRHRYLALRELNEPNIKAIKIKHKSTEQDLIDIVSSKEVRRHETPTQLAISAYYIMTRNSGKKITQAQAATMVGADRKFVGLAKQIAIDYKRPDILESLFNGGFINIGNDLQPFNTNSLQTIINWIKDLRAKSSKIEIDIKERIELTDDEEIIINKYINSLKKESQLLKEALAKRIYASLREDGNH